MCELPPVLRVAIVGPESCGKSTLAAALATRLRDAGETVAVVDEYARAYYAQRPYQPTASDVLAIARGQLAAEQAARDSGAAILLCDSTVLTCRIWAEVAFGEAEPALLALNRPQDYDLTLLTAADLPWQPDPLRSYPHARAALLARYVAALQQAAVPYHWVTGQGLARVSEAWQALRHYRPYLPVF